MQDLVVHLSPDPYFEFYNDCLMVTKRGAALRESLLVIPILGS
jgi:hypothetical protein